MTPLVTARDASDMAHGDIGGTRRGSLSIGVRQLSECPGRALLSHWHEELEVLRVLEGEASFCVNEREVILRAGDCLAVNSRQMHSSGLGPEGGDCRYLCLLAGLDLFSGNRQVWEDLVAPIVEDEGFDCLLLDEGCAGMIDRMSRLEGEGPAGRLEMLGLLHLILARVRALLGEDGTRGAERLPPDRPETAAQKAMVSYICQHYPEKISLAEIAAAGRVCRSRCCSIFRKYLRQSPIDFLNSYRLTVSLALLRDTEDSISDVAAACGFAYQSYYTRLFGRHYGCTPNEYRARVRSGRAA